MYRSTSLIRNHAPLGPYKGTSLIRNRDSKNARLNLKRKQVRGAFKGASFLDKMQDPPSTTKVQTPST